MYILNKKGRITLLRAAFILLMALSLTASAAAAATGTSDLSGSASASTAAGREYHIVTIGDSIAAGYVYGFTEKSIPYGIGEHVYEQALFRGLRAEYSNYGILGLRTAGLKNWLSAAAQGTSVKEADVQSGLPDPRAASILAETKQLAADLRKADLIIISIGGNDFLPVLKDFDADSYIKLSEAEQAKQLEGLRPEIQASLENYASELEASFQILNKLQPKAEIVIADQYLPIPPPIVINDQVIHTFPENAAAFLKDALVQLRDRLDAIVERQLADGYNIKIVDASEAIAGKELVYTSISKGDIHPTLAGYAALGKAFTNKIWGDGYKTAKPRANGVPISIIVNGEELITDFAPVLLKGRTFLSLRDITDVMGADLDWNANTKTASIELDGRVVDITIGATTIRINGKTVPLQAEPAFLHKINNTGKTYIPLAALSEGLGFQVIYSEQLKAAFINK